MQYPDQAEAIKVLKALLSTVALLLIGSNVLWFFLYNAKTGVPGEVIASVTPSPAISASPLSGTIAGNVGYPGGTAPAQTVCAVNITDASKTYCTDFAGGNSLAYHIDVPAGSYIVYASLKANQGDFKTSYKAYYDKFVTCGLSSNCADSLHGQNETVRVEAGGTVTKVDPVDWYALGISQ